MTSHRDNPHRARVISVAFTVIILGLILSSTLFRIPPDWPLAGAETGFEAAPLTLRTWLDGSFARDAEIWLLRKFGLRGFAIRLANQLDYDIFGNLPKSQGTPVTLGRDGWLFESSYLRYYEGQFPTDEERVSRLARQLASLQCYLARHGIRLAIVVSPSKLEIYPEHLPDGIEKAADTVPAREQVITALSERGIPVIDARRLFLSWKREPGAPLLFHPYGTHWNAYGAQRILDEIGKAVELSPPLPHVTGHVETAPFGADCDLLKLLNIPFYGPSVTTPYPILSEDRTTSMTRLKALIVGDSFSYQLIDAIGRTGRFSNVRLLYYFRGIYDFIWAEDERPRYNSPDGRRTGSIEDHGGIDWKEALSGYDIIILEFNEIYSKKSIWGFSEFVLQDLPQEEIHPNGPVIHDSHATPAATNTPAH